VATGAEKLNSRKLWVSVGTELLGTLLLVNGIIEPDHWVTVTITVIGAYLATQAWEDINSKEIS
jgi:hypothetical protein